MHPALLIDEVLQLVFDCCSDLQDDEPKWTFAQLARCCKAWQDPALDRLWARLSGVGPLLSLLPKVDQTDRAVDIPPAFLAYAGRVKQITHAQDLRDTLVLHSSPILPRLEVLTLSFQGCAIPHQWAISPFVKRVNIDIGFAREQQVVFERSNAAAAYLHQLRLCAPEFHSLRVRGRMTDMLNGAVASLSQLRSLTVQGNCFLSPETLAAIATFPFLQSLKLHAGHIQAYEFEDALVALSRQAACFPALQELSIRTNGELLTAILVRLPVDTLAKLRIDMTSKAREAYQMKEVFELLAEKASATMSSLTIEDEMELDDSDASPYALWWYSLDILRPLAQLKHLQRFVLAEPDLVDAELEQLAKWWPALEHLDLGTLDSKDFTLPKGNVRMTSAAYGIVAKSFTFLQTLALPAYPPTQIQKLEVKAQAVAQKTLRSLSIGDVPNASTDATAVVDTLLTLFPSLVTIDCPTVEVTERFDTVIDDHR